MAEEYGFLQNVPIFADLEKDELIKTAQKYSPVFNTLTKSAPVTVQLDK